MPWETNLPHKKGHGIHVRGKGLKLDIVVGDLNSDGAGVKSAVLKIKGLPGREELPLERWSREEIAPGLMLGIKRTRNVPIIYCYHTRDYNVDGPKYYGEGES